VAQTLKFTVEVAADQATQALSAVSLALNQAGIEGRSKLLGIGPAAASAGKEIQGLTGHIKDYVSEQRAQGRMAGFFVREITDIIPASDGAKTAMSGLIGAMAGGFGAGMVVDLAITGVKLLVEELRSADKEIEDIAKRGSERVAKVTSEIDALRERGKTPAQLANEQRQGATLARGNLLDEAAELRKINEQEEARLRNQPRIDAATLQEIETRNQRLRVIEQELSTLDAFIARKEQQVRMEVQSTDAVNAAKVAEEEYTKALAARAKQERDRALYRDQGFAELEAGAYGSMLIDSEKEAASARKRAHAPDTSGLPSPGGFYSLEASGYDEKEIARQREEMRKDEEKALQDSIRTYEQWGSAVGNVFGGIVTQQMTVTQGFQAMGRVVLQSVLQMAVKEITANAAVAGSESAKTGALAGPAGAAAMASATMAVVMSLLGGLPSARNGWWDTGSYEGLMWIHKRERVLNAREAQASRDGAAGGGAAGTTNNFYATYMDRAGAQRLARDVTREQRKASRRTRGA
jgi:hypothetical protein